MSKPFEFGQTVFIFLSLVGVCIWIGTIWKATGEDRLNQACMPLEFATDGLHQITEALIGYPPRWTLYIQSYLMGGCYYFFSVILPDDQADDSAIGGAAIQNPYLKAPQGGVRQ
jgi:hypothetical protein